MSETKFYIGAQKWAGLSKLIEESGEVMQVCGKILGADGDVSETHWDGSDLKLELEKEIGDLLAAIRFVRDHCGLSDAVIEPRITEKQARFERWHELGRTNMRAR